jgi:hypothetical protein
MSTDTQFVRKTKGITGSIGAVFNAIGSIAGTIDNIAAGAEEATHALPELGHDSGQLLAKRAKKNLEAQLLLADAS